MVRSVYIFMISSLSLLVTSCGSRLKHASDVSYLFSQAPKSVGDIATDICKSLAKRGEAPTTKGMLPQLAACEGAGLTATDFDKISAFTFNDLPGSKTAAAQAETDVFSKSIRTQIWLNRQLPQLLPLLNDLMKQKDQLGVGDLKLPESATKDLENLVKPVIKITEAPKINLEELTFSLKLHVEITGAIKVANDILIDGKVFSNGIAVTISTPKPYPSYKDSFLQSFDVVFLVIPYAKDIYLDMAVDMSIYNIGLSGPLDKAVNQVFGSGLKTMVDALIKVGDKS